MNDLPSEAYAILHRRHSDPFHYLGRHRENGHDVVRVYLPMAKLRPTPYVIYRVDLLSMVARQLFDEEAAPYRIPNYK